MKPTDSRFRWILTGWVVLLLGIGLSWPPVGLAHEPIFGLGPHTIFRGGVGIEMELEHERETGLEEVERATALHTELLYGLTDNLALTLAVPAFLGRHQERQQTVVSASGLGDVALRVKYRFWRRDLLGTQDSAAVVMGVKFPTGRDTALPRLGSGSTDFLFGLAAARESRRWYFFGDIRYRYNTTGSERQRAGDGFFVDIAVGIRPWLTEYYQPDLVLLVELNAETRFRSRRDGQIIPDSGSQQWFLSPGFFFTYRNWAVKGGVQIPVLQRVRGNHPEADVRLALAVEVHL